MSLNLVDLNPKDAEFGLSHFPKKIFTLKRFSLAVMLWARGRFGEEGIKDMFFKTDLERLSELAFYQLKEKDVFKDLEEFRDNIITSEDRRQMIEAVINSVGASQPKKEEAPSPEQEGPKTPIGAQPTTSSPQNTATA